MIRSLSWSWALGALAASAASPQEPADVFPAAEPASLGVSAEALEELGGIVEDFCAREKIVGAEVLVIKDQRTVFHRGYGWRDREAELPMVPNTIFNLRSMTKAVIGAAAQILVDEGRLQLDAPIAEYLPAFDNEACRSITVDQVLSHRAGFPLSILTKLDEYPDLRSQASAAAKQELLFEPGSKFWYSDAGADIVGALVAAASGEELNVFVERRLLEPLGMRDSFFSAAPDDPRWSRVASLYGALPNGGWVRYWQPEGKSFYPFAWGSQSLYGSPADYCRFLAMWADGGLAADGSRVLSERAVASQTEPLSRLTALGSDMPMPTGFPDMEPWYGRLAVLYRAAGAPSEAQSPTLSHSGSDGTIAWVWPEHNLTAAIFTQSRGSTAVLRLESDVHRALFEPDINAAVPAAWNRLVGTYTPEEGAFAGREIDVLLYNRALGLDVPGQMVFTLSEPDADGWRAFVDDDRLMVRFVLGEEGPAEALEYQVPGMESGVAPRGTAAAFRDRQPKTVVVEIDLSPYPGIYHDPEADLELRLEEQDGKLVIHHPSAPIPLVLVGPDEEGFFTLEVNPAVKLRFTTAEDGSVDGFEAHAGGQALRRPRLRDLD